MRISLRLAGGVAALALLFSLAMPQDGLGKKKGGGGSGSGGGSVGTGGGSGGGSRIGGGGSGGGLGRVDNRGSGSGSGTRTGGGSTGSGTRIGGGGTNGGGTVQFPPTNMRRDQGTNQQTLGNGQIGLTRGRKQSRSGTVQYNSVNNFRIDKGGFKVDRARVGFLNQLDRKIQRSESRVGIVYGHYNGSNYGYRWGYSHWDYNWRDDYFWYPHYVFDPFGYNRFVCSPWYYYSFLPPYLNTSRVIVVNNYYAYPNWSGERYEWRRPAVNERYERGQDLDFAIDDIVSAFERGDRRAVGRLIPRNGAIAIFMDGRYNYSLNPDDFYDLYMDAIENARTRSYTIEDVRTSRGVTRLTARHEYTDTWGNREIVYHYYTLEEERGGYVIREFGTEYRR